MPKVVLSQRDASGYDDVLGSLYHFPKQYLPAAQAAVGDACVFYEPRRGEGGRTSGRQAYWAAATIRSVFPDQARPDHFYLELADFLPFDTPVSFRRADGSYWEAKLARSDGQVSKGAMGVSIRRIPDDEFTLICTAGFSKSLTREEADTTEALGVRESQQEFERPIIEQISSRKFRDRVFAQQVRGAYDSRCAITGLRIINGGGRAEMEAAHIRPVAENGPDTVRNGLALSRTVHWMFDRGLISLDDDYRLLKSKGRIPEGVDRLFDPSGYAQVPEAALAKPSARFLRWHRENCFKG